MLLSMTSASLLCTIGTVLLLMLCSIGVLVLLGMTSATSVILRVAACTSMYQCCSVLTNLTCTSSSHQERGGAPQRDFHKHKPWHGPSYHVCCYEVLGNREYCRFFIIKAAQHTYSVHD